MRSALFRHINIKWGFEIIIKKKITNHFRKFLWRPETPRIMENHQIHPPGQLEWRSDTKIFRLLSHHQTKNENENLHRPVLDQYTEIFKLSGTPSNKRKWCTTQRWDYLTKKCEEFHNLGHQFQIDSLIDFLLKCSSRISEPPDESENSPRIHKSNTFYSIRLEKWCRNILT